MKFSVKVNLRNYGWSTSEVEAPTAEAAIAEERAALEAREWGIESISAEEVLTLVPSAIVVQSHGMGVESQAILERWIHEPASRPFASWADLIVVTAQVGEEHKNDTIFHMEKRTLPELRRLGVRFVELARRGPLEEDGIVVLQDTREPVKLHPEGAYKLSDELLSQGTVPQFGGEHRCAMKFKAFVIETWLAYEFRHHEKRAGVPAAPVHHVFGYNAEEVSRINNSNHHIKRHNQERAVPVSRTPIEVFGFNSEEIGRIERSRKYDGPERTGLYPLEAAQWNWNRQQCLDYIFEKTGILWKKSHCSFCPFCREAEKGLAGAVERWRASPEQTAHGLMVEYNALCFNPRGQLYSSKALIEIMRERDVQPVLQEFERRLAATQWGLYRVRRIYTKKGSALRCVERLQEGTREAMQESYATVVASSAIAEGATRLHVEIKRGISYAMFASRVPDVYPAMEGFYVIAPLFVGTKLRGPIEKFNERWDRVLAGGALNDE